MIFFHNVFVVLAKNEEGFLFMIVERGIREDKHVQIDKQTIRAIFRHEYI